MSAGPSSGQRNVDYEAVWDPSFDDEGAAAGLLQPSEEEILETRRRRHRIHERFSYDSLMRELTFARKSTYVELSDNLSYFLSRAKPSAQHADGEDTPFYWAIKVGPPEQSGSRWRCCSSICDDPQPHCSAKLKFHISLLETDDRKVCLRNRAQAWNIVSAILIERGVYQFKIIRHDLKISSIEGEQGKDITIYTWFNPKITLSKWRDILNEIMDGFRENNIKCGAQPSDIRAGSRVLFEKPLQGSDGFISYRFEIEQDEEAQQAYDRYLQKHGGRDPIEENGIILRSPHGAAAAASPRASI